MRENSEDFEIDRYTLFSRHPGLGALLVVMGLAIPGLTMLVLAAAAPDYFFGSLTGRLLFTFITACTAGFSAWLFDHLRNRIVRQQKNSLD